MCPEIRTYFESLPIYTESPFDLKDDDSLIDLGLIDSLGFIDFMALLENTFDLEIEQSDLTRSNFESIQKICNFVELKMRQ